MPIEPALLAKRRQDADRASMERPEGRMPVGSVRRDGMDLAPSLRRDPVTE
jgi:hypothetical protein